MNASDVLSWPKIDNETRFVLPLADDTTLERISDLYPRIVSGFTEAVSGGGGKSVVVELVDDAHLQLQGGAHVTCKRAFLITVYWHFLVHPSWRGKLIQLVCSRLRPVQHG